MRTATGKRRRRDARSSLITSHLGDIKRALLESEKRPAFLEFVNQLDGGRTGIYALYDERGRLHYAGKASDLPTRINQHLRDKHKESWDRMSLFFVKDSANVPELEGLVIATAKPPANKRKPKVGTDLRKALQRYLKEDESRQIEGMVYPERGQKPDKLFGRITERRLGSVSQAQLGRVLGISQGRVSQLKRRGVLRQYVREAGKRDAVLLLLQSGGSRGTERVRGRRRRKKRAKAQ